MNKKPTGVMKGSGTMGAKGDNKGAFPTNIVKGPFINKGQKLNSQYFGSVVGANDVHTRQATASKIKAMAKVMKAYPQGTAPSASKVVKANTAATDQGKALSQANSPRKLKYIGA